MAGFPCQAFSIAGYRKGFDDERGRGNLFFRVANILGGQTPNFYVLENVKNLKTHDSGRTFQTICHVLTTLGYSVNAKILNAKDYSSSQNRERIYIVGQKDKWTGEPIPCPKEADEILPIPKLDSLLKDGSSCTFSFDSNTFDAHEEYKLTGHSGKSSNVSFTQIDVKYYEGKDSYFEALESRSIKEWEHYIYNGKEGHFKKVVDYISAKKNGDSSSNEFDVWDPSDDWTKDEPYQFIYQWRRKYLRKNKSSVCPTLTANMGTGGHNVPLVMCGYEDISGKPLMRKLTPEECFRFQHFPEECIESLKTVRHNGKPLSNCAKYKQVGNSVPVNVIELIAQELTPLILSEKSS